MIQSYTAKYTKIDTGYMGQLVEWTEVVTEGKYLEECRQMLRDATQEMVLAYQPRCWECWVACLLGSKF